MKKTVATFFIAISMVVCFAANSHAEDPRGWEKERVDAIPDNPGLKHVRWELARPPFGAYDRIALHRVVNKKGNSPGAPIKQKVILMLPGSWEAGGWSKLSDPNINTMLYLATNGYDVYTISFRNYFLPNVTYEQFAEFGLDISGTGEWTFALYREDVKACVDKIKEMTKAKKIFMGGFSRGSIHMFIYASKYQEDLKGLISLGGWIKAYPPRKKKARDEAAFNDMVNALKAGSHPVPPGCAGLLCPPRGTMYQLLAEATYEHYDDWQLAAVVPNARGLFGGALPPEFSTVSDFVANDVKLMWGDGKFSNYGADMIDREVLVTAMAECSRYYPTVQNFEINQLLAWKDVPYFDYDDNEIDLPAIAFLSPLLCPKGVCLKESIPNMTVHDDVTVHHLPDYGHIDLIFGKHSLKDVKQPLLTWLDSHL